MSDDDKKIVAARIVPPQAFGDRAKVFVEFAGAVGDEELLISYFDDELSFTPRELIGLTAGAARELWRQKDLAYLRS